MAEEGVAARDIATVIAGGLGIPTTSIPADEAQQHFDWFAMFANLDMPASSTWTRERLDWQPIGPGLIADLKAMDYSRVLS